MEVFLLLHQHLHRYQQSLLNLYQNLYVIVKIPIVDRDTFIYPKSRKLIEIHNGFLSLKITLIRNHPSTRLTHRSMRLSSTTQLLSQSISMPRETLNNGWAWLSLRVDAVAKQQKLLSHRRGTQQSMTLST